MSEFHKNWKKFLVEGKDNEEEGKDSEELSPEQSDEMDKDKDGDIDGEDLKKLRKENDAAAPPEDGGGEMNMRNDVKKVVQFLFHKSEQVSAYMEKIKGDKTESAQLIAHMLNELGMSVQEFNQILPKVKQNMAEAKYKDIVREELKKVFR